MHPIALLAISVLMTTTGQLLLKEGMNRHGHLRVRSSLGTLLRVAFNPWIVVHRAENAIHSLLHRP